MQFPPIKKGGNNALPNPNMNAGGNVGGVQAGNDNYVKNIKKNP